MHGEIGERKKIQADLQYHHQRLLAAVSIQRFVRSRLHRSQLRMLDRALLAEKQAVTIAAEDVDSSASVTLAGSKLSNDVSATHEVVTNTILPLQAAVDGPGQALHSEQTDSTKPTETNASDARGEAAVAPNEQRLSEGEGVPPLGAGPNTVENAVSQVPAPEDASLHDMSWDDDSDLDAEDGNLFVEDKNVQNLRYAHSDIHLLQAPQQIIHGSDEWQATRADRVLAGQDADISVVLESQTSPAGARRAEITINTTVNVIHSSAHVESIMATLAAATSTATATTVTMSVPSQENIDLGGVDVTFVDEDNEDSTSSDSDVEGADGLGLFVDENITPTVTRYAHSDLHLLQSPSMA